MMRRAIKNKKTEEILGCSFVEFRHYFESLFQEGMTWKKFLNGEIHIDHIIPLKYFDLSDAIQIDCANHYLNLQPLYKKQNSLKGSRLPALNIIHHIKNQYKIKTGKKFIWKQ